MRQGCPLLPLLLNIVLEVLARAIRQEKEIKAIQIRKNVSQDDIILYVENPEDSTKKVKINKQIQQSCRIQINIQKSLVFLHTNNKQSEKEFKKTIPFTIASKRIKYFGINVTKEVKDLHTENHKTMLKEIIVDPNR